MTGDWVKIHRALLDSRVFHNEGLLKVWIWCLLKASYRRRWVPIAIGKGISEVELQSGQFIFGRDSAAAELRIAKSTVRDHMEKLAKLENLTMQSNSHYTLVTICKWAVYQSADDESRQPTQQPGDSQPTAARHKQEGKEGKEGSKKEKSRATALPVSDSLLELIDGWNLLGTPFIATGARRDPPSKAVLDGWHRAQGNGEQRNALADIPAIIEAIRGAAFCHGQGWFRLEWLFATNKAGSFNIIKLLEGGYANRNGSQSGTADVRPGSPARPRNEPVAGYRDGNAEVAVG